VLLLQAKSRTERTVERSCRLYSIIACRVLKDMLYKVL